MEYTRSQIERAKRNYKNFLRIRTLEEYNPEYIGYAAAEQRMEYDNAVVTRIKAGDKALEREWKLFFLMQEVKADQKEFERKEKLAANAAASEDIVAPIRQMRKLGEYKEWLKKSKFRKEFYSNKYSQESVSAFLEIIK